MITFRKLDKQVDYHILENWIEKDQEHKEKGVTPNFFFDSQGLSMVLEGNDGPGLYLRLDPEIPISTRIHIQFSPDKVRSGKTLLRGWKQFSKTVKNAGVSRIVFESVSPSLIGFCKRCFGFNQVENSNDYEVFI